MRQRILGTNEITFYPSGDLTVVRTSGNVVADDLGEWAVRLGMNAVTKYYLWDITQADISRLSATEIYADEKNEVDLTELRKVSKAAIVSANDHEYGLAKILKPFYRIYDLPFEVQVFRSFEDAKKWIGVRPNPDYSSYSQPTTHHEMFHR